MNASDLIGLLKKHPVGFTCGIICVVCAGMIYYTGGQLDEGQQEYEAKSAEAGNILGNVRNSAKLPEQVAEIQVLAKEMDSRLVNAGQIAVNQQFFYKLEAETDVKMTDMHQNPLTKKEAKGQTSQYTAVPFHVNVQGSLKQLLDFQQRVETGPHFCRFTSLGFLKNNAASAGADPTGMTLTLNLEMLGTP